MYLDVYWLHKCHNVQLLLIIVYMSGQMLFVSVSNYLTAN